MTGPSVPWYPVRRFLGTIVLAAIVLAAAGCSQEKSTQPPAAPDCVDFRSYLHVAGSVQISHEAWHVAASGNRLFVAGGDFGLQVLDVSGPESPSVLGAVLAPGYARGVAVQGQYAYLAEANVNGGPFGGLRAIDIADPRNPEVVGSIALPRGALSVAVSGAYAYVAADTSGLQIVDITDPRNPSLVGGVGSGGDAHAVAVSDTCAYVVDFRAGLQVVDIRNPREPEILGSLAMSPRTPRKCPEEHSWPLADGATSLG